MNIRTENGIVTLKADGAIAKGDIVYFTSDGVKKSESATQAKVCGVALDGAADEALVPVAICGAYTGTCPVKVTAAIAAGEFVDAAGGKGAKAVIVTTEKCNAAARHRAAQLGVTVIDLEELQSAQLARRLRIVMKVDKD